MQNPKPCRVTLCAKGPQNTRTCDRHAHITHILNDAVGVGVIGHRHRHVGGHLRGAFGEHLGNIQGTFREHMVGVGADRHEQRTGGTTSHAREEARIRQPGPGGHQRRQPGVCARARRAPPAHMCSPNGDYGFGLHSLILHQLERWTYERIFLGIQRRRLVALQSGSTNGGGRKCGHETYTRLAPALRFLRVPKRVAGLIITLPPPVLSPALVSTPPGLAAVSYHYHRLGLDTDIKPLLSHSTNGEFYSAPKYLRTPHVRVEPNHRPTGSLSTPSCATGGSIT
eukprot:1188622-Prorocentrum_minimum.AAC.5